MRIPSARVLFEMEGSLQTEPSVSRLQNKGCIQRGVYTDPAVSVLLCCRHDQGLQTFSCMMRMVWSSKGLPLSGLMIEYDRFHGGKRIFFTEGKL